jgi:hypothetical protein
LVNNPKRQDANPEIAAVAVMRSRWISSLLVSARFPSACCRLTIQA